MKNKHADKIITSLITSSFCSLLSYQTLLYYIPCHCCSGIYAMTRLLLIVDVETSFTPSTNRLVRSASAKGEVISVQNIVHMNICLIFFLDANKMLQRKDKKTSCITRRKRQQRCRTVQHSSLTMQGQELQHAIQSFSQASRGLIDD
jgi:hypothetical protein